MRLAYFEMIDRVESIDLDAGKISVHAYVPKDSTVFEGHFPGHSAGAGRFADRGPWRKLRVI